MPKDAVFECSVVCLSVIIELRAPRGFGDLGRRAIYLQGAGEHC